MASLTQEQVDRDLRDFTTDGSLLQQKILEMSRSYLTSAANRMCKYHESWDNNDYIYRGYRLLDRKDKEAQRDGEPSKIIVPITFAQIQTAQSFLFSTFAQKDNIFELRGLGPEDCKLAFGLERDLAYQCEENKFLFKQYNWSLDALKHGFGVVKNEWTERYSKMRTQKPVMVNPMLGKFSSLFGGTPAMKMVEQVESILAYQGTKITNVSPYAFYPDPSVTISNFQDGEFCGHEDEVTLISLKQNEGILYNGTERIPPTISKDLFESRARRVSGPFAKMDSSVVSKGRDVNVEKPVILSELQVTIIPKQVSERWQVDIGQSTLPVKYIITIANDQKVIRFQPLNYLHGLYTYSLFEFSPDNGSFYNPGLADTIYELQNIITFFLNSHIVNVRKIIANRFIVDPSRVDTDDINTGSLYIKTKGSGGDIGRAIQQLEVSDITRNHIADMDVLTKLVQMVTGINENALGQYSAGRRSATEARSVNAGSSARLKMHATLMWLQGIKPLGQQMIANTRQSRTKELYNMIVGDKALECPFEKVILADPSKIAGNFDFIPYDATLPSDRQQQAAVLTDLFTTLIKAPQSMQLLNKNPLPLLNYIAELYGIRNLEDFDLSPLGQPMAAGQPPAAPQAQVMPDAQVQQMVKQGRVEPVDMTGQSVMAALAGQDGQ
jgi:hypothetical protein